LFGHFDDSVHFCQQAARPELTCLMAVGAPYEVRWVWPGWVPLGKLTVVEGHPGVGKSALLLDLAARLTVGAPLPDGGRRLCVSVCVASAEDGAGDTVGPRLLVAGADLGLAHFLGGVCDDEVGARPLELPLDVGALEKVMREGRCRLLILDPLAAYLGRGADARSDQSMRRCLFLLAEIGAQSGCAVVLVRHLKASARHVLHWGVGSIGTLGAARSGLLVARDPDSPEHRVLVCTKPNLSAAPRSLRFRVVPAEPGACRVEWCGPCDWTAEELLRAGGDPEERGALAEACEVLRALLKDGPRLARDCQEEALAAGVSERTLKRAKQRLQARSLRARSGRAGRGSEPCLTTGKGRARTLAPLGGTRGGRRRK
jgi:hypothetical protein